MEQTVAWANPEFLENEISASAVSDRITVDIYATIFASLCIVAGLIWDICWHISIGRDGLLSPPHLAIYAGAIVSGLFSGYEILRTSFCGSWTQKAARVRIFGFFYSSLGGLYCVWGSLAMLTSAPFDDWWHNTYGLDVTILSPPHTVLILGMMSVQFGSMINVVSLLNRVCSGRAKKVLFVFFSLSAGILLTMWFTLLSEQLSPHFSHQGSYYVVAGMIFPLLLVASAQAVKNKWTLTLITGSYTGLLLLALWIIPLFPAQPRLGPVLNHIDHFQGFWFPLPLIIPAVVMDILRFKCEGLSAWKLAMVLASGFIASFFVTQWLFGAFLLESPAARNWVFGSHYMSFSNDPDWIYRYRFAPENVDSGFTLAIGLVLAWLSCLLSTRAGLRWGKWMSKVQR